MIYKDNLAIIAIGFIFLMLCVRCNPALDFDYGTQVSSSISESKMGGVFISQYKIEGIKVSNDTFAFPIKEVWAEKSWSMNLDSTGKEFIEIHKSDAPNLVFLLNNNDSLSEYNYLNKWILIDADSSSTGTVNGRIFMRLNKITDSIYIQIFRLSKPYNYKQNLKAIANFILKSS